MTTAEPAARTTVVNVRTSEYDVYIGRPSTWGNPWKIDGRTSRRAAIEAYRRWFRRKVMGIGGTPSPIWVARVERLRGMRLGCHCAPKACHGDVIAAYLNGEPI